jgi:hypothetical protein
MATTSEEALRQFVVARLKSLGIKRGWLADQMGIKEAMLSMWLSGARNVSTEWIVKRTPKMADALQLEAIEILDLIEDSASAKVYFERLKETERLEARRLNKAILQALLEEQHPTELMLQRLLRAEREAGEPLSYEACLEFIRNQPR